MGTESFTCKTYCSCNLGSSFWSTSCGSLNIAYLSDYYSDVELFSNISSCYTFTSWLVTSTIEMETECFMVRKCGIPSQPSPIRTLRSKFFGLDRAFRSCHYSRASREYVQWNNLLDWNLYAQNPDSSSRLFGTSQRAGTSSLTHLKGFHPQTQTIAFIFLIAGLMYRTNFGIGNSMKDLFEPHIPPRGQL
ncbi:hypothetical protein RDABS01_010116 [Bienertia sinuspersici]